MAYLDENFLLHSSTARRLFHEVAKVQPIIDYQSNLSLGEIAKNHRWANVSEFWLGADPYKWRAMRANGIEEDLISGTASPREKFEAWAQTVPFTLRNSIYHTAHIELQRYFGIDLLLSPQTSEEIWQRANAKIAEPDFSVCGFLKQFNVRVVGTTDDPADPLDNHLAIAASGLQTKVIPTFRADEAFMVDRPDRLKSWLERLESTSDIAIVHLSDLLAALQKRHDDFHEAGARLSDHERDRMPSSPCSDEEAAMIFNKSLSGRPATPHEKEKFSFYLMVFFGQLDAAKGWTKQLRLGVERGMHLPMSDIRDSDDDRNQEVSLKSGLMNYLDTLSASGSLPKMIIHTLDSRNIGLSSFPEGIFQNDSVTGKIHFGSGWWLLGQKNGIELQMNALSSNGLLHRFVGMLTDSSSFSSFPRHEYFRRVVCSLIGGEAERGELPNDFETLSDLIRALSYENSKGHFGFNG
jgi:glucuronate isomerase